MSIILEQVAGASASASDERFTPPANAAKLKTGAGHFTWRFGAFAHT
jgi:hypothetical protein